ncbi:hypothetical protein ACFE04_024554 [Oxalis oulophora]
MGNHSPPPQSPPPKNVSPPPENQSPPPTTDQSPPPAKNQSPPQKNQSPPPKKESPPPDDNSDNQSPPATDNQSPTPSGNQSPTPSGNQSPTPSGNQSPTTSGSASSPPPATTSPTDPNASPVPTGTPLVPQTGAVPLAPGQPAGTMSPPQAGAWFAPPTLSSSSPPPPASHNKSTPDGPPSPASKTSSTKPSAKAVVGVALAGVFLLALVAVVLLVKKKKKRKHDAFTPPNYMPSGKADYNGHQPNPNMYSGQMNPHQAHSQSYYSNSYGSQAPPHYSGPDAGVISGGKNLFTYEELAEMTGGFSRANILGEGGFGCVYKGTLPTGKIVAVKQLKAGSGQGEREFRAEVEIIGRVHHRHLVYLIPVSAVIAFDLILIFMYIPDPTKVLDWSNRVKIAIGSAKGLAYLHEDCHPKIIHRDIKTANILLEDDFEAKVADFGLARLNDTTQTHVSTRVMGTFGYLAPEYASSGKLTDRSDVFSFGVVLLELITGRKPVDPTQPLGEESLVEWARPRLVKALQSGDVSELVDPRLEKNYVESEVLLMIEIATASVRHSAPKRPRMVQIVRALDSEGDSDLSNGVKYGQSTVYDSAQYNEDIMKFRRMALGSETSSEYDMLSGDFTSREVTRGFPPNSGTTSAEFTKS